MKLHQLQLKGMEGAEIGKKNYPLSVVNKAGEDDDAKNEEKHEEHQLLGWGSESLE